jgi:WD40 repeat protein
VNVQLWNVVTGKELQSLLIDSPDAQLDSAVFSPDGRKLFTGNFDGPRLWDLQTGKELLRFASHSEVVESAAFSADGRRVLTGSINTMVRLLDAETGKEIQHFAGQHSGQFIGEVDTLAISPDGSQVLTLSGDGIARLWSVETGKEVQRLAGQGGHVNCVAFSSDARQMPTEGSEDIARLWSLKTGKGLRSFAGQAYEITSLVFASHGRGILTADNTGMSWWWDAKSGRATPLSGNRLPVPVQSVAGSPNDEKNSKAAGTVHSSMLSYVVISPDGRRVLTPNSGLGEGVWDVQTGKEIQIFDEHILRNISSAVFSLDGHRLLVTDGGAWAWLWDVETGKEVQRFVVKPGWRLPSSEGYMRDNFVSVAFSSNGSRALTGDWNGTARLWDVETGKQLRSFKVNTIEPLWVAFSPDGRKMLSGSSDHPAELRDVETGRVLQHFGQSSKPSFSDDGCTVLLGSSVWDVSTGKEVQRFATPSGRLTSGTLSADGRTALIATDDGTTRLLDVKTGKELASMFCFRDGAWAVIDPEGRFDTDNIEGNVALHWVLDSDPMRPLPLAVFKDAYYTPHLLSRILKGETLPPIRSVAGIENRVHPDETIRNR